MGVSVLYGSAVGIVLGPLSLPDAVEKFFTGIPGVFFSVFLIFFTYELYRDFSVTAKAGDDLSATEHFPLIRNDHSI